jgi:hypothetical protein
MEPLVVEPQHPTAPAILRHLHVPDTLQPSHVAVWFHVISDEEARL